MVKNDQEAHLNIGRENRPKEEGKNSHSEKAEGKPSKPKTGHPSHDEKNKEIEKDHTKVRGNKKYRNTEGQRIYHPRIIVRTREKHLPFMLYY